MGSCQTSEVIESNKAEKKSHSKQKFTEDEIEQMIENQKQEFPDMKEWKGKRYQGIGIKKMKGYKCNLKIDDLNKKRDLFWGTRNSNTTPNYKIWRIINQACVYDELRANMLLEENELTTADGCINHIIDKKGNHYIVPNYCINDPYFEKEFKYDNDKKEEKIKLILYEVSTNTNTEIEISNLAKGSQLIEEYKKKVKIPNNYHIRLFYSGSEIKDNHLLYQFNLKDGNKIVVMKLIKLDDNNKGKKVKDKKVKKIKKKKEPEHMDDNKEELGVDGDEDGEDDD